MKEDLSKAAHLLDRGLVWGSSHEGQDFWVAVNKRLNTLSTETGPVSTWELPEPMSHVRTPSMVPGHLKEALIILNQNSILLHPMRFWDDVRLRLHRLAWPGTPYKDDPARRRRSLLLHEERRRE